MPVRQTSIDRSYVYATPDPVRVDRLSVSHGFEAASERWHWICQREIHRLIADGRAIVAAKAGSAAAPDPAGDRIIAYAQTHGLEPASLAFGVAWDHVRRLFLARGLELPTIGYAERSARGVATRRRLQNAGHDSRAMADAYLSGMTVAEIAQRYGLSRAGTLNRLRAAGIERRAPGTNVRRAA